MKAIIGLGNPGEKYHYTRHNFGFLLINELAKSLGEENFSSFKQSVLIKSSRKVNEREETFLLVKPLTFMNLSGQAVREVMDYYKIASHNILIATDDVNLPFGYMRIKEKGSHGGHNGLKSIESLIGSDYPRLRFGVGNDERIALDRYVLSNFSSDEKKKLSFHIEIMMACVLDFIDGVGFNKIKSKYNGDLESKV